MINEVTFTTFEEVRKYFDDEYSDRNENFVFRGHSNAEWELVSTLNRLIISARTSGAKQEKIKSFVDKHLRRFKSEIKGRRGDNPSKLNKDETWALGQHYGLATPLLDWTNSPYISLFFAFSSLNQSNLEQDRCVWALNINSIKTINKEIEDKEKEIKIVIPEAEDNKRIISQSGLFTKIPVMSSVEDWVRTYDRLNTEEPALTKITINCNRYLRKSVLKHLELMNIKFSTIYPDLIGASMYCNIKAENYEV